jgi:hypothetical protein
MWEKEKLEMGGREETGPDMDMAAREAKRKGEGLGPE